LTDRPVSVSARALTPEQAIGNPEHDDYPVVRGRERMVEAEFLGARGQAFTDRPGGFAGTLEEVLSAPVGNDYRRAVFLAVANAVCRRLGLAERTAHCKDADLLECASRLPAFVAAGYPGAKRVFLVGLQPRFAEALAPRFALRITDLDAENVGALKGGVRVEPADAADDCLRWCDLGLATGSTLANGTADRLLASGKPVVFYGVSCAAAAALLGLARYCPLGR
jgi:hypothetical protein